jgi:archaemetzincin
MPGLDIVPIYFADREEMLHRLGTLLEGEFHTTVRYRNPWFDPEDSFDASRGQYSSTHLLKLLLEDPHEPAERTLGVAMVSLHRLRTDVYGLPPDEALLFQRLHKEAVHELGHTYGLLHCANLGCVMRSTAYAEEIELKSVGFCEVCSVLLRQAMGGARQAG